jgi:hypothetical protein
MLGLASLTNDAVQHNSDKRRRREPVALILAVATAVLPVTTLAIEVIVVPAAFEAITMMPVITPVIPPVIPSVMTVTIITPVMVAELDVEHFRVLEVVSQRCGTRGHGYERGGHNSGCTECCDNFMHVSIFRCSRRPQLTFERRYRS